MLVIVRAGCLLALSGLLQACAGGGEKANRHMQVSTQPAGATCEAERAGTRIGSVGPTPATLSVTASGQAITLTCRREGSQDTVIDVEPETRADMVAAYTLAGGLTGILIGAASADIFRYPATLTVAMVPAVFPGAAERDAYFEAKRTEVVRHFEAELGRIQAGCEPTDPIYCQTRRAPVETRRDAALAKIEAQRAAARVDG